LIKVIEKSHRGHKDRLGGRGVAQEVQNGVGFNYGLDHVGPTLLAFLRSATSHAPKWHYVTLLGLIASPDDRGRIADAISTNLALRPPALYP
jgi:hypothetical protein